MIRNRWAALAAMMCSLAAQGFALAQQTNTPAEVAPQEAPTTGGAIVAEPPVASESPHLIIRLPDGTTRQVNLTDGRRTRTFVTARVAGDNDFELQELPTFVIGVSLSEIPESLRAHLNLAEGTGIMVGAIIPDSPAAKAGLQQYDLLLKSGDRDLKVAKDLQEIVDGSEGKSVSVTLQRKGQPVTVDLTPVKREDLKLPQTNELNVPVAGSGAFLMRSGDDPVKWLELMQAHSANPNAIPVPMAPMINVHGTQMHSLTDSILKLTDQIERLQKAVDRLEQRQGVDKPEVPAEEQKASENGGALRMPRPNLTSFISLS